MKSFRPIPRGFGLLESVLAVLVLIVIMAMAINYVRNQANASRRAQETDQNARELALVAKAAKDFVAAQAASTYPLNTTVAVPIASLISAGNLPANFAQRLDAAAGSITPFGQPYTIVARRIVADEDPTIVVAESGTPSGDKLRAIGIELQVAPVFALKEQVAQRTTKDYQSVAGTIPRNSRIVTGTGRSFTKDLTAYFGAAFAEASAVALKNFRDLEPDDDDDGSNPIDDGPTYTSCRAMQGQLIGGVTSFYNICSAHSGPGGSDVGDRIVGTPDLSVCSGHGSITVLPFGGTMTAGMKRTERVLTSPIDCPGHYNSSTNQCDQVEYTEYGQITMNSVIIDTKQCGYGRYEYCGAGCSTFRTYSLSQASFNVCCRVED